MYVRFFSAATLFVFSDDDLCITVQAHVNARLSALLYRLSLSVYNASIRNYLSEAVLLLRASFHECLAHFIRPTVDLPP